MPSQPIFFDKNKADFSNVDATATASESADIAGYVLNRSNLNGWMTSGSADANGTTLTIDMGDVRSVTDILLVKHNFKSYTVQYSDDGVSWNNFSPAINETTNTETTNRHSVTEVLARYFKVTINGTQVANADKSLAQFICTSLLGQLVTWPLIKNPIISRNKIRSNMLSGKANISENVGGISYELDFPNVKNAADLELIESLYFRNEGFLVWIGGGDESQFSSVRMGYRKEDLILMKCSNDYEPEFARGLYQSGVKMTMKLVEVVE